MDGFPDSYDDFNCYEDENEDELDALREQEGRLKT